MNKYALRYTWATENRKEGYTEDDAGEKGLADAMIGISILLPDDGSYSQALFSFHGKEDRELNQNEIFKAWLMLGLSLHDTGELKGWKSEMVKIHSDIIRSMFNHSHDCATNNKGN